MAITIAPYEPWMREQVAALFSAQYGITTDQFTRQFDRFYDHPYQRDRSIRLVALEGTRVMGFQSFFYWPYVRQGRTIHTWQSGKSLVHPDSRGQGVFQRLLEQVENFRDERGIELLVGFPVKASYRSFMKNGWDNPFDLRWYVALVNPVAAVFGNGLMTRVFEHSLPHAAGQRGLPGTRLLVDDTFDAWRANYSLLHQYYRYEFSSPQGRVAFALRHQRRGRFIRELIVGDIAASSDDPVLLHAAFRSLRAAARRALAVTVLSIAVNERHAMFSDARMRSYGFRPLDRHIHFITKQIDPRTPPAPPDEWLLFRSDVDTW